MENVPAWLVALTLVIVVASWKPMRLLRRVRGWLRRGTHEAPRR